MIRSLATLALTCALALPASAQQRPDVSAASADAALAAVRTQALRAGIDDAGDLVVADGHTSSRSGVTYLYVRQQVDGLDVTGAQVTVAVDRAGRVLHTAGDLIAGLSASAQASGSNRTPVLTLEAALRAAAARADVRLGAVAIQRNASADEPATLVADGLRSPATVREVYVRTERGALRRAYAVSLDDARSEHWWVVTIDAATGEELGRYDQTVSETFGHAEAPAASLAPVSMRASMPAGLSPLLDAQAFGASVVAGYRVYPLPIASPIYAATTPPADGRSLVSGAEDATASPFGWHDTNGAAGAEFTITRGNNTHAYVDRDDDEAPDAAYPEPDGGAALLFDFPINFSQQPVTYTPAATTQLFYLSNVIHDIVYKYGFTEAAGNFQQNNYSRGGSQNDAVDSEVQSGADICNETNPCVNNANFATGNDGQKPRMQMYIGTSPNPDVDGALDAHVVVHEYGHGISTRLVGGRTNSSCLRNAEQMGEGWSDWYGNMLTMRASDTRTTRRPVGNYLFGQSTAGGGIRNAPYSTDFAVNNYTYQRTRSGVSVPHGIGFVWATALWEATWDMIDAHGFSADVYNASGTAGNQIMLNLVTEGLKLTSCNPGFIDGRDAILAADAALYPSGAPNRGTHYATLWTAFARRGLGLSATQGSTGSNGDNTEAFDTPLPAAQASVTSSPISRLLASGRTSTATVTVGNTAAAPAEGLTYTAAVRASAPARPVAARPSGTVRAIGTATANGKSASAPAEARTETTDTPGTEARGAFGGTGTGGYSWTASDETGGPTYNWVDLSTSGTAVPLGDDQTATVALPFSFPYYGTTQTSVRIASNGFLMFGTGGTGSNVGAGNVGIPNAADPNGVVAPYWDDLNPSAGGQVRYRAMPDGRFVVSWIGVPHYVSESQTPGAFTFQAILSPSGRIDFQYETITPGSFANSATIGTENLAGTEGLQVVFNGAFATNGKAVRILPPPTWISVSPASGTIAAGQNQALTVMLDATGLAEGTYRADVVVTTSTANAPSTVIPVTLTVGGAMTVTGGAGWRALAPGAQGVTVDDLAAMNLVQGVPGYYPAPQASPNLYTDYTGTGYVASTGTGQVLQPGRGFMWLLYDQDITPGGPSLSRALPMTLTTDKAPVTTDTPVAMHASGDRFNLLGNPFGQSLDLNGVASWPGASNLASNIVQIYNANTGTYDASLLRPTVASWQGFFVEAQTAGTLTIPASARTTGGTLQRTDPLPMLAFELTDGERLDRAAILTFGEDASEGADRGDATKLAPLDAVYVSAAFGSAEALRAVDNRPMPEGASVRVPLHVASVGAGTDLTLTWPTMDALPETWEMTLTDLVTGATIDLRTQTEYAFTVTPEAARGADAPVGARAEARGDARFAVTVGARGAVSNEAGAGAEFALDPPRPNPMRASADIAFSLAEAGTARLSLVDLLGREVAVLADGERAAGRHTEALDAARLAPGVYVVRLVSGAEALTRRVVVVR